MRTPLRNLLIPASILSAALLALGGCSGTDGTTQATSAESSELRSPGSTEEQSTKLTDDQVLYVMLLLDAGEVEQAREAEARAVSKSVLDFAGMMERQHGADYDRLKSLGASLGDTPMPSTIADELHAKINVALENIRRTFTGNMDLAYVASQVGAHRDALRIIETELLPAVRNPELHAALLGMRGRVQEHLQMAIELRLRLQAQVTF